MCTCSNLYAVVEHPQIPNIAIPRLFPSRCSQTFKDLPFLHLLSTSGHLQWLYPTSCSPVFKSCLVDHNEKLSLFAQKHSPKQEMSTVVLLVLATDTLTTTLRTFQAFPITPTH